MRQAARPGDRVAQRLTGDVLHDDHQVAVGPHLDVVDGDEVRVAERGPDERLPAQSQDRVGVPFGVNPLERDPAPQHRVLRERHGCHPADAQALDLSVAGDVICHGHHPGIPAPGLSHAPRATCQSSTMAGESTATGREATVTGRETSATPALGPLLGLAGVVGLLLIAFAGGYGYHRDELYFIAAGDHLAWSSRSSAATRRAARSRLSRCAQPRSSTERSPSRSTPTPTPGRGEVLVRVHAAGLNGADMMQLRAATPRPPAHPRTSPGSSWPARSPGSDPQRPALKSETG